VDVARVVVALMVLGPSREASVVDTGVVVPVEPYRMGMEAMVCSEVSTSRIHRASGKRWRSKGNDQYQDQKCCGCVAHVYHIPFHCLG
jgi:hypothetical protein